MSKWTGYMVAAGVWLIVARTTPDGLYWSEGIALFTAVGFHAMALIHATWALIKGSKERQDG